MSTMETAIILAVDARRERKGTEKEQTTEQEQGKTVRFREEEQSEETRAQSTGERDVMSGFAEVRTGRGSAGLIRG